MFWSNSWYLSFLEFKKKFFLPTIGGVERAGGCRVAGQILTITVPVVFLQYLIADTIIVSQEGIFSLHPASVAKCWGTYFFIVLNRSGHFKRHFMAAAEIPPNLWDWKLLQTPS